MAFLYPCENDFDYTQVICGGLCYASKSPWLAITDRLIHDVIPVFFIAIFSICLLGRVIWQKYYHMRLPIRWYRHRKMSIQIFPLSILYLCCIMPYGIVSCINSFGGSSNISMNLQQLYFFYLFYLLAQLLPFVYLAGMPKLYSKLFCRRTVRISPIIHLSNQNLQQ